MTTRWRPMFNPDHLYFVTTTAVQHQHLFRREIVKRIVVDTLHSVTVLNSVRLYAFVVMPNHIHAVVQCPEKFSLSDWARVVKSTVTQLLVRYYQVEGNEAALNWLGAQVKHARKQRYKVWEDSYLAKEVVTAKFMLQKIKYIHENPVQPHWRLSESARTYRWSSAAFYEGGACYIPVDDAMVLLE